VIPSGKGQSLETFRQSIAKALWVHFDFPALPHPSV